MCRQPRLLRIRPKHASGRCSPGGRDRPPARAPVPPTAIETPSELAQRLAASLEAFDEDGAHELLDRLFYPWTNP